MTALDSLIVDPSSCEARGEDELRLILVGDTNVQGRADPASAFQEVQSFLDGADVLFGHLEGPLTRTSEDPLAPDIPHKLHWRHSDPGMARGLRAAGFAAMSCASNVTYPPRAAIDTAAALREAGIAPCGVGRTLEEARQPALVERRGVRFGFLSYTSVFWPVGHAAEHDRPGVATIRATTSYEPPRRALEMPGAAPTVITRADPAELAAMVSDVRRLRERADIVVLSCHWGVSGSERIADYQQEVGRAAIDAGADIVIGHHPHVLQPIEIWKARPIFYSLGNFAFDWPKMRGRHLDGIAVGARIRGGRLSSVELTPVRRGGDNLVRCLPPSDADGQAILQGVARLSASFGTTVAATDRDETAALLLGARCPLPR